MKDCGSWIQNITPSIVMDAYRNACNNCDIEKKEKYRYSWKYHCWKCNYTFEDEIDLDYVTCQIAVLTLKLVFAKNKMYIFNLKNNGSY